MGGGFALNVSAETSSSLDLKKQAFGPKEECEISVPEGSKFLRVSFRSPVEQEYKHVFYTEQKTTNLEIVKRSWGGNYRKDFNNSEQTSGLET